MASKEEILRAVLELDASIHARMNTICERLSRIEAHIQPKDNEQTECPACKHACGVYEGCAAICAYISKAIECACIHSYHKAYKTPLTD